MPFVRLHTDKLYSNMIKQQFCILDCCCGCKIPVDVDFVSMAVSQYDKQHKSSFKHSFGCG